MLKRVSICCLVTFACIAADQALVGGKPAALQARVTIEVRGDYRYIVSNGIPDHEPGKFPNPGNPNTIAEQKYEFRVPLHPKVSETSRRTGPILFGVALNGVPFDPGTAELWHGNFGWRYEAINGGINLGLDQHNAHVQPGGKYHYHALPTGLIDKISVDKQKTVLVGYAADGFPIYSQYGYVDPNDVKSGVRKMKSSYKMKLGDRPAGGPPGKYDGRFGADWEYVKGLGDLDECNGRIGATPEYPEGIYHYYITEDFPFIARQFKGEPDPSFQKKDGPGRGPRGGPPPGGPPGGFGFFPPPPPRRRVAPKTDRLHGKWKMKAHHRSILTRGIKGALAFAVWIVSGNLTCVPAQAHPLSQGRIEMAILGNKITLNLTIAVEEIIVQQALTSGDDDKFPISSESYRRHGAYLLQHFCLNVDGRCVDGKIVKIDEPDERSFHPLDMGRVWATYEIGYIADTRLGALQLSQNMLNEIEYEPGNRWEVSYIARIRQDGKSVLENMYLSSSTPLKFTCAQFAPSLLPVTATQHPAYKATSPTVDAALTPHLAAYIALVLSAIYLLAAFRKRRTN